MSMSTKKKMTGLVLFFAVIVLAVCLAPGAVFADDEQDVKKVAHVPYKHAKHSRMTQEYGPNSLYLHCEWEHNNIITGKKEVCEFASWPLIVMSRPDDYYDGKPKEAYFNYHDMVNFPFIKSYEGFPYEYAEWDGKLIYTGVNGTVVYGPSEEAPIGEGTYYVYAKIRVPRAKTLTSDRTFILGKTFTILNSSYDVYFDSNKPDNASTEMTGKMVHQHFNSQVDQRNLYPNQFRLPGYKFDSWNTKPDGTGEKYLDTAFAKGLSYGGKDVTLYAQWKPKKYEITYSAGDAPGNDYKEEALFDQSIKLKSIQELEWEYDSHQFLGWSKSDYSMLLDDEEEVVNLGGPLSGYDNDPQDAEIVAQWVGTGQIVAVVTKDGETNELEPDGQNLFLLKDRNYGTTFRMPTEYKDGRYVFDPSDAISPSGTPAPLPEGDYELILNAKGYPKDSKQISYSGDKPVSAFFDYYTVSLEPDPAYKDVHSVKMTGVTPDENGRYETLTLDDTEISINTIVSDGYHFDGYSALGITPEWKDNDNMKPEQTIKVTGHAEIMAHVEANKYTVHFDANTKSPIIGEMEDQDMVYDQPQNLHNNMFQRSNAVFTGWNTRADGSGKAYNDGESVKNLTADDDGKVTLYAQWKDAHVKTAVLTFDLKGGILDGMVGEVTVRENVGNVIKMPKAPVRDGYKFKYWKGSHYKPGDSYKVTGDHTFTAVWEKKAQEKKEKAKQVKETLIGNMKAKGKTGLRITWKKVKKSSGYDIFFNKCSHSKKGVKCKKVKTVKGNKTFKWTKKGLKKSTAYKAYVKAYVYKNGKKTYVKTSPMMHAYTGNGTKKYTNAKSVTLKNVKKGKLSLKKGKTFKIKAKVKKVNKKKKLMSTKHAPTLRYMTSDRKVAAVSKKGKITAKGQGKCTIYVFAHNGVSKQISLKVK